MHPSILTLAGQTLRFEMASCGVTPMPAHSTGWRTIPMTTIVQVLGGETTIHRERSRPVRMGDGGALFLGRNVRHKIDITTKSQCLCRWSHPCFWMLGRVDVTSLLDVPIVFSGDQAQEMGEINVRLTALKDQPPSLQATIDHVALGLSLLSKLAQNVPLRKNSLEHLRSIERLAPALDYIHQNLGGALSRDEIAEKMHLSPSRFQTVFRKAMGLPPRDYIQNLRLQNAQQLLIGSELGVSEIARRSGFEDPFHFSRLFKKRCGCSPSEYRGSVGKTWG